MLDFYIIQDFISILNKDKMKKLSKILIFISITFSYSKILSQDTTYYDANWKITTTNQALYFFTKPYKHTEYPIKADDIDIITEHLKTIVDSLGLKKEIKKIDFCYSLIPDSIFIGKKVKVYYKDHFYSNINQYDSLDKVDWPNEQIRKRSGESYKKWNRPMDSDTGKIVWVFKKFFNEGYPMTDGKVYLVQIDNYYIPIVGKGLTMTDKESWAEYRKRVDTILPEKTPISFILTPGISLQTQTFMELNLTFAKIECGPCNGCSIAGPMIGIESNLNQDHWIYAPKIGFQAAALLMTFRGSVINYIDKGHTDLRILPEIGIGLMGAINLTYGYNIPLLKFEIPTISRHRISLTINLARQIWYHL